MSGRHNSNYMFLKNDISYNTLHPTQKSNYIITHFALQTLPHVLE